MKASSVMVAPGRAASRPGAASPGQPEKWVVAVSRPSSSQAIDRRAHRRLSGMECRRLTSMPRRLPRPVGGIAALYRAQRLFHCVSRVADDQRLRLESSLAAGQATLQARRLQSSRAVRVERGRRSLPQPAAPRVFHCRGDRPQQRRLESRAPLAQAPSVAFVRCPTSISVGGVPVAVRDEA